MLSFRCHEPDRVAQLLDGDRTLLPLLAEIAGQIGAHFPRLSVAHVDLKPTGSLDGDAEAPGLLLEIYTDQELADAEASLERLDLEWWLERSLRTATPVVVDIRFV